MTPDEKLRELASQQDLLVFDADKYARAFAKWALELAAGCTHDEIMQFAAQIGGPIDK